LRSWGLTRRVLLSAGLFAAAVTPLLAHVRITTKVTWEREIEPIFQARCVTCHREGGRAPMPLATYEQARPWAKAIKEEVLARRMPKWHVVRGYGDFTNDPSLSSFEVALIASWADGGGPQSLKTAIAAPAPSETPKRLAASVPLTRDVRIACAAQTLPAGRIAGLHPQLTDGASLRLMLLRADGTEEPLIWLRDFDPEFAETYWLRMPLTVTRGMRLAADPVDCSLVLKYLREG
jgi:hypothetical protein